MNGYHEITTGSDRLQPDDVIENVYAKTQETITSTWGNPPVSSLILWGITRQMTGEPMIRVWRPNDAV